MGVRVALRRVAAVYRKTSRLLVVLLLAATLISPVFAQQPPSGGGTLSIQMSNVQGGTKGLTCLGTEVYVQGNLAISGDYSGPVYLVGSAYVQLTNTPIGRPNTMSWTFWNGSFWFSGGSSNNKLPDGYYFRNSTSGSDLVSFYSGQCYGAFFFSVAPNGTSVMISAYSDPSHKNAIGSVGGIPGSQNQMFQLDVELPLINDPMLGAPVTNTTDPFQPQVPGLGSIYNMIMVVAIFIIGLGAALALIGTSLGGGGRQEPVGTARMIVDVSIGILVIVLFPLIYNNVAHLINYLDASIIAGPGQPVENYVNNINMIWGYLGTGSGGVSVWSFLWNNGFFALAGWIIAVIGFIMAVFVGIIRLFLVGVMLVAFPLSMGLRLIPFAKKLSEMVDDTLYGLILASLMSAVVLGAAAQIFDAWGTPGNIFNTAGLASPQLWVAAAAIFTAVLIPTVFAPLTATVFQTASQAAMTGVGVGAMIGTMGAGGIGAGVVGGMSPGALSAAFTKMGIADPSKASMGQSLVAHMRAMGGSFARVGPMALSNIGMMAGTGILGGVGATQAAKSLRSAAPVYRPGEMLQAQQESVVKGHGQALANEFGLGSDEGGAYAGLLGAGLTAGEIRGIHGAAGKAGLSPSEYLPMAVRMRQQSGMNGQDIAGKFSGFGQSLGGAVTRMNGMADVDAGAPSWAEAGVQSGHDWADELMQSQGRAAEHVAAHLGTSDLTSEREFKDIAHRRIVGEVFQRYQHDDQKLWNLYRGLNNAQQGGTS